MSQFLEFSLVEWLKEALTKLGRVVNLDILFYIFVSLELATIIYFIIRTHFCYELRTLRTLDKINLYLLSNPYIKEENLIEFNRIMKRVPHVLRYHWQQYMLNRDKAPSNYVSSDNIIEKPLKSSALATNIKTTWLLTGIFALLSAFGAVVSIYSSYDQVTVIGIILSVALAPSIILFLGAITVLLQRIRKDVGIKELYNTFHIFQNLLDKACTTIPEYVDFEVLFTQKEIARGIPVLNDYLEKRDRQIQEEMEKARLNAIEHEVYDFDEVDINGTLILERALKESEVYINLRNRIANEIQQIDGEIDSLQKTYDNQQRDYQRKLQASKENVTRLRQQQEATTNRIDSNYIRKQVTDEVNKQQQLEKDNDDTTVKFQQELATLKQEIEKRKQELVGQKNYLEKSMLSEYDTYSGKVYKGLRDLVEKRDKDVRLTMASRQEKSNKEIMELKGRIENLKTENSTLRDKIEKIGKELTEKDLFYTNALLSSAKGKKYKVVLDDKPVGEYQREQEQQKMNDSNSKYDEYGGYYDEEGYYRYKNGTYYDPEGNFFDEFGGHYDSQGNYYPPEEKHEGAPIKKPIEPEIRPEVVKEVKKEEFVRDTAKSPIEQDQTPKFPPREEKQLDKQPVISEAPKQQAPQPAIPPKAENNDNLFEDLFSSEIKIPESSDQNKNITQDIDDLFDVAEPVPKPPINEPPRPNEIVSASEGGVETPKKAKPGRPKKVLTAEEIAEQNKPKGKPGRPKKNLSEEDINNISKPKRKPGRPKKEDVSTDEDDLEKLSQKIDAENQILQQNKQDLAKVLSEIDE